MFVYCNSLSKRNIQWKATYLDFYETLFHFSWTFWADIISSSFIHLHMCSPGEIYQGKTSGTKSSSEADMLLSLQDTGLLFSTQGNVNALYVIASIYHWYHGIKPYTSVIMEGTIWHTSIYKRNNFQHIWELKIKWSKVKIAQFVNIEDLLFLFVMENMKFWSVGWTELDIMLLWLYVHYRGCFPQF